MHTTPAWHGASFRRKRSARKLLNHSGTRGAFRGLEQVSGCSTPWDQTGVPDDRGRCGCSAPRNQVLGAVPYRGPAGRSSSSGENQLQNLVPGGGTTPVSPNVRNALLLPGGGTAPVAGSQGWNHPETCSNPRNTPLVPEWFNSFLADRPRPWGRTI